MLLARPRHLLLALATALALPSALAAQQPAHAALYLTTADRSALVAPQPEGPVLRSADGTPSTITIDPSTRLQTIDGFGFALTGGSAQLLRTMSPAARHAFLQELLGNGPGQAGVSYLRLSIGASDMNDHVYTYDDVPAGETDPTLARFSLAEDQKDVIPVLQEMLQIRPSLTLMATPWTAPSWMKSNDLPKGGSLKPELYPVYARYLVRYLQGMQSAGIPIAAITPQNEPLNPKNTPSMEMLAPEEDAFVRDSLGPALHAAHLATKIILWDHNCDHPEYPISILQDPRANPFADGSGFHLYAGPISAMSTVHDTFPTKNLYFTEQMVIEEHNPAGVLRPIADPISRVVIGATRNWSRNVLLWNLAADPTFGPHTGDGGCPICQGAVTLAGDTVTRNIAFYTIAQVSRFVPPGSIHIASTETDPTLTNVAFQTPSGQHVLLITNTASTPHPTTVTDGHHTFTVTLPPGSAATLVW